MSLSEKIKKLKQEKKAVILAHNYQLPEIQDLADYVGDSLGLSIQASQTDADVIVFCGVSFMAETAKILSPQKTVLIPDKDAGCPMARMITADQLKALKSKHPDAKVICYVNSTAEVKAESDLCCTSANAVKMVNEALKDAKEIIFIPDQYLAGYASLKTGRDMIIWKGYCPSHVKILPEYVQEQKRLHPEAKVLVHPECRPEVIALADEVLSTEGMLRFSRKSEAKEIIIGTEIGIIHRLKKENPGKTFYPASHLAVCPNMKKITLEKVLWSLDTMDYRVEIPQAILSKAKISIEKMLDYRD
ncbi:MAG: quinolinate synthase NadA [Candidatus Aureabacteria bacterium]|nr:quinolinate synthase NadA [Candidatus Auribacterota bacterium]